MQFLPCQIVNALVGLGPDHFIRDPLHRGTYISNSEDSKEKSKEAVLLLARPVVRGACDLDLLFFLRRHPRSFLTSEQLAAFVGYDSKQIAKSVDWFIDAGLLERTQNPTHAARMYLLVLEGPQRGGLIALLKLASTRQGRQDILQALDPSRLPTEPGAAQGKRRLLKIA